VYVLGARNPKPRGTGERESMLTPKPIQQGASRLALDAREVPAGAAVEGTDVDASEYSLLLCCTAKASLI